VEAGESDISVDIEGESGGSEGELGASWNNKNNERH
jgi:hypothetical protein